MDVGVETRGDRVFEDRQEVLAGRRRPDVVAGDRRLGPVEHDEVVRRLPRCCSACDAVARVSSCQYLP